MLLKQTARNYQITASGACFRTETAACLKYMTRRDWRNWVSGHSVKGVNAQKTAAIMRDWIRLYAEEADTTIAVLQATKPHERDQVAKIGLLLKRWEQIRALCSMAMQAVACS